MPTIVTRAIGTTTQPLRTARQVFEEFEEITFSLKRTRKVVVHTDGISVEGSPFQHSKSPELDCPDGPPQLPSAGLVRGTK